MQIFFGEYEAVPRADPQLQQSGLTLPVLTEPVANPCTNGVSVAPDFFALARKICAQDRSVWTIRDGPSTDLTKLA